MKRNKFIIIILSLILSNIIILYLYINELHSKSTFNNNSKCYVLNGKGENIEVKNFKIISNSKSIQVGDGEFKYIGDPSKVDNSTYYKYDVVFIDKNNPSKSEIFYSVSGVTIPNSNDYIGMGGVTQPKANKHNSSIHSSTYNVYVIFEYGKVTEHSKTEKIKLNTCELDCPF